MAKVKVSQSGKMSKVDLSGSDAGNEEKDDKMLKSPKIGLMPRAKRMEKAGRKR
jgi:hypothetical protein